MKTTYTREEMLDLARELLGFDHKRTDCLAVQTDGIDPTTLIERELRNWYLDLLDHGPVSSLAPTAVAVVASRPAGHSSGTRLAVPTNCRRVLTVHLAGWQRAVTPLGAEKCASTVARQLNPYTRASVDSPVAVVSADGSLLAWPEPAENGTTTVTGAVDSDPETYIFDDSALASLKEALNNIKIPDYGAY